MLRRRHQWTRRQPNKITSSPPPPPEGASMASVMPLPPPPSVAEDAGNALALAEMAKRIASRAPAIPTLAGQGAGTSGTQPPGFAGAGSAPGLIQPTPVVPKVSSWPTGPSWAAVVAAPPAAAASGTAIVIQGRQPLVAGEGARWQAALWRRECQENGAFRPDPIAPPWRVQRVANC